ncbi:hypothetical protein J4227_04545 [Candidatus Woesearchaeota archaeon]|nr:hypothetical protein [Candidatus Woesearchaeota archaeon]
MENAQATVGMTDEQIRSRLVTMRDKISVLEWDEKMGQINPYKKVQLDSLRKEFKTMEEKLEANQV